MLRWGIVGYGWLARDYADPALRALVDARLVAVCDPDPIARELARSRGLIAVTDIDALCDLIDVVYIATPNSTHRGLVEHAAARGKHVLCEKPMATSLADGEAMLAACAHANVAYATAYDQRHHPAHRGLRASIAAGELGIVTAIRIVYACWLPATWTDDNWRVDAARSGGGALVDLAPHGLDLVAMLLDDEIVEARAFAQRRVHTYDVDDGATIVARTRGDVLAQLHVAYNYPETLPRRRLEVVGTRGLATATDTMGQTPGGTLAICDAATGHSNAIVFDELASPFAGLVRSFTNSVASGSGFDRSAAERERSALAIFDRLVRDAASEAVVCR